MRRLFAHCASALAIGALVGCASRETTSSGSSGSTVGHDAPLRVAHRVAEKDTTLTARLSAKSEWASGPDGITSPGFRASGTQPKIALASRLPHSFEQTWQIGVTRNPALTLGLRAIGASKSDVALEDGRAEFKNVYPGVDAVSVTDDAHTELLYVLRDPSAAHDFSWSVDVPESLSAVHSEASGGLTFGREGDKPWLRMTAPYAVDANGIRRNAVASYNAGTLRVKLDTTGLAFPVVLDPSFETVTWTLRDPGMPSPRQYCSGVWDSGRKVVVMFGGFLSETSLSETWEWNGKQWALKTSAGDTPAPRSDGNLAYDPVRKVTVLFGGEAYNGSSSDPSVGDTWEWDGTTWTQKVVTGPSARMGSSFSYVPTQGGVVLFGGSNNISGAVVTNDMWKWDGTTWTQICTDAVCLPTIPAARGFARSATDASGKMVLFGGYKGGGGGGYFQETWTYDGTKWSNTVIGAQPPGRTSSVLALDEKSGELILFGGYASSTYFADTWGFKNGTWVQKTPIASPDGSTEGILVYDGTGILSFGGDVTNHNGSSTVGGDQWRFDGNNWARVGAPASRQYTSMAYDSARKKTVLFGGNNQLEYRWDNDTWEWDGTSWTWIPTAVSPGNRAESSMVYDSNAQRILLFGGGVPQPLGDTLSYDGTTWKTVATSGPPARLDAAMAFDSTRNVTVLYGGSSLKDTWEWDSQNWTQRCLSAPCNVTTPSTRSRHAMAYDVSRKKTVLFGGSNASVSYANDTWEWDGVAETWTQVCATPPCSQTAPPGKDYPTLAYDAARHASFLFGGDAGSSGGSNDVWLWDGTSWSDLGTGGPHIRSGQGMAYDSARSVIVMSDGAYMASANVALGDTWEAVTTGGPCSVGSDCPSGNCVESVCCDKAACAGACNSCNTATNPGVCTAVTNAQTSQCFGTSSCDAKGNCLLSLGSPCSGAAQCVSGQCAQDVCCESACSGGCATCNQAGKEGSCALIPSGTIGACAPYVCAGDSPTCPTACSLDDQCAAGFHCLGAQCVQAGLTGVPCVLGTDCTSGFCVEGVCCDSACASTCQACSKAKKGTGADGVCGNASSGTVCGTTSCATGTVTGQLCDGSGQCAGTGSAACAPYVCNTNGQVCATTCTTTNDCTAGSNCVAGTCTGATPSGQTCLANSDCSSGFCAEGICCATPCNGSCLSCYSAKKSDGGPDGVCGPVAQGSVCGQTFCATGTLVGSICDNAGNCSPTGSELCAPYVCASPTACSSSCTTSSDCAMGAVCTNKKCVGTATPGTACIANWMCASTFCVDGVCCDSACDGVCLACSKAKKGGGSDGECLPVKDGTDPDADCKASDPSMCKQDGMCDGAGQCRNFAKGTSCGATTCTGNVTKGQICDGFGNCEADPNGVDCAPYACKSNKCSVPCTDDTDCSFGSFCDGGTCRGNLKAGDPCIVTSQCSTGFCTDGVCCDSGCTGQCEACDIPMKTGICTPTAGAPHGKRPACATDGSECGGVCDGANKTMCTFPPASTSCNGTSCQGAVFKPSKCTGAGECKPDVTKNCLPFGCDEKAQACKTKCAVDDDCASGAKCNVGAGQCVITGNVCTDAFTIQQPDGQTSSCSPYKCTAGACDQQCVASGDCATGYDCTMSRCQKTGTGAGGGTGTGGATSNGGKSATAGSGGTSGAPAAAAAAPPADSSGCSCIVAGETDPKPAGFGAGLLIALVVLRRRRSDAA